MKDTVNSAFLDQNVLMTHYFITLKYVQLIPSGSSGNHHKDWINRTVYMDSIMLETMYYLCFESILFFLGIPGVFEHLHYTNF